jgi:hypothetical protein
MEKVNAIVGDSIKGDQWSFAELLHADDGFKDSGFPGCQFRVHLYGKDIKLAVNVKTTGKPKWNGLHYQSRCKIEFVGDYEPSTFTGGTIYHLESIQRKGEA